MADDHRRAVLAGHGAAGPPAGLGEVLRHLQRALGVEAQVDDVGVDADGVDPDPGRFGRSGCGALGGRGRLGAGGVR